MVRIKTNVRFTYFKTFRRCDVYKRTIIMELNSTEKIYDKDSYIYEFDATVVDCLRNNDGSYQLILDRTAFFPEGGGQAADCGILMNMEDDSEPVEVPDVQIDEDDIIRHKVDRFFNKGTRVHGIIDFEKRYDRMQQHTGEHIFSGVANKLFGCDNVGFHLNDEIVTLDLNQKLSAKNIADIETKANVAIRQNIEVIAEYPDDIKLHKMGFRRKGGISGAIRVVTIGKVDSCACCAPHLKRTGEVMMLKVQSVINYKEGVRVTILCGMRALRQYNEYFGELAEMSHIFSVKPMEVKAAMNKLIEERNELVIAMKDKERQLLDMRIANLGSNEKNACLFAENIDKFVMRSKVNELSEKRNGYNAIFDGNDNDGYSFIIGSADRDTRKAFESLKKKFDTKGGGKKEMVQGSVMASKEEIKKIFSELD